MECVHLAGGHLSEGNATYFWQHYSISDVRFKRCHLLQSNDKRLITQVDPTDPPKVPTGSIPNIVPQRWNLQGNLLL